VRPFINFLVASGTVDDHGKIEQRPPRKDKEMRDKEMSSLDPREFSKIYFWTPETSFWALRVAIDAGVEFAALGRPVLRAERGKEVLVAVPDSDVGGSTDKQLAALGMHGRRVVQEPCEGILLSFGSIGLCEAGASLLRGGNVEFHTSGTLHVEKDVTGPPFDAGGVDADMMKILEEVTAYCAAGNAVRIVQELLGPEVVGDVIARMGNGKLSARGLKVVQAWVHTVPQDLVRLPDLGNKEITSMRDLLAADADVNAVITVIAVIESITDSLASSDRAGDAPPCGAKERS